MATLFIENHRPFNFAHLLTSVRLVLTPVFLLAIEYSRQQPTLFRAGCVGGLFVAICASDYYDGPIARALGLSSDWGKILDNLADITFLLVSLTYLAYSGIVPWWIPCAVGCAFGQYTLDSWWLSRRATAIALVSNPIGHWAGVLNYVGTGLMACHAALQQQLLPAPLAQAVLFLWLGYLLLAMGCGSGFFAARNGRLFTTSTYIIHAEKNHRLFYLEFYRKPEVSRQRGDLRLFPYGLTD